ELANGVAALRTIAPGSTAVTIESEFYWPPFPTGAVAGYTAPIDRWVGTKLSGIGGATIQLGGYVSQTYRPEHHNFSENFIFDPHLEAEIDSSVISEFDQRGIQAIGVP